MLHLMRKHAKSWIINILVGAIVLVFIFWGVGSYRDRQPNYVAMVNDEQITLTEYRDMYNNIYEQVKSQYRDNWNEEIPKTLNLQQQALDALISETLLFQEATAMNIQVSKEELRENIVSTEAFQVNGVFDPERYRSLLSRLHYTPESYEILKLRQMTIQRMEGLIISFTKVSPAEVEDSFHFKNDRASVEFVLVMPENFLNQAAFTEAELKAYYEKNKENYQVPAMVQVAYLPILPQNYLMQVQIADEEINEYYELNKKKYSLPASYRARHILLRLDENASAEEAAEVEAEAAKVLEQARSGANFGALAEKYSQDSSAAQGGDLGWFSLDQMVKPFAQAVSELKPGQISGMVRTQFGLHIIKLDDSRPASVRSAEDAKKEITVLIVEEKAKELAADRAVEIFEKISLAQDFEGVLKEAGLTPTITDFFPIDGYVEGLGTNSTFNQAAHSLNKGEIGPLLDLPEGHVVMKALDRKNAYIPKLEEKRPLVESDLKRQKAEELAGQKAEELMAVLKKGGDWNKTISESGLRGDFTEPFTRLEPSPNIGTDRELIANIFAMTKPGEIGPKVYKGLNGYYLVRLKEKLPADLKQLDLDRERLTRELQMEKSQGYLKQWIETLHRKAKIKLEKDAI